MTANAMKGDRERCLSAGMDDYVAKPVRSRELFATLEKYADAGRDHAARGEEGTPSPPPGGPVPDGGERVFDEHEFEVRNPDKELMCELIDLFEGEANTMLGRIESAAAADDAEALHQAAHALKGMIGNYGTRDAYERASELNALSRDGDLARAGEALPALRKAVEALGEALRNYRESIRD